MEEREYTCCFTGHRSTKLPWGSNCNDPRCIALQEKIYAELEKIYTMGYRHFICGMAIGCDTYFAEAVLRLKNIHNDVILEAAIPCGSQPDKWRKKDRLQYNSLVDRSDKITVLQIRYTSDCMMKRNEYMVDRSSLLLACFDGSPGGTMKTLLYAMRKNIQIIRIDI